jgi:uncharacterized protein YyaL (SSP411 family)
MGQSAHTNRLIHETSPYLQQHAHNPVDWYPWGAEALEKARREDKPILLSIGYSACHWCHDGARIVRRRRRRARNERAVVCIKVDREERPDLDKIYQTSHQVLAQRPGGWPLNMLHTGRSNAVLRRDVFSQNTQYGMPDSPELLRHVAQVYSQARCHPGTERLAARHFHASAATGSGAGRASRAGGARPGTYRIAAPVRRALGRLAARETLTPPRSICACTAGSRVSAMARKISKR